MSKPRAKPDPLDRRLSPRSRTDIKANIAIDGRSIACVIRDRSITGARLVFKASLTLPPEFSLIEERGAAHLARLIWTDGLQAGVQLHASRA